MNVLCRNLVGEWVSRTCLFSILSLVTTGDQIHHFEESLGESAEA